MSVVPAKAVALSEPDAVAAPLYTDFSPELSATSIIAALSPHFKAFPLSVTVIIIIAVSITSISTNLDTIIITTTITTAPPILPGACWHRYGK